MTHVTCRLTAKNRVSFGTLCSVIEYGLPLPFTRDAGSVRINTRRSSSDVKITFVDDECWLINSRAECQLTAYINVLD